MCLPGSNLKVGVPGCTFLSVGNLLSITNRNVKLTDSPSEIYKSSFYHVLSGRVTLQILFYHVLVESRFISDFSSLLMTAAVVTATTATADTTVEMPSVMLPICV
jgi:hypothetical protein